MNPQRKSLIHHISHQVLPSHSDTWWIMFLVHAPWGRGSNHRRRWLRLLLKKKGSFLQEKWRLLSTAYLPIDLRMFEIFCSCFLAQHITNLLRGGAPHSGQGAPTTSVAQICLQASAGGGHWGSSRLHLCWADDNNQHSHFLSCFILHLNLNFRLVSWVHGQRGACYQAYCLELGLWYQSREERTSSHKLSSDQHTPACMNKHINNKHEKVFFTERKFRGLRDSSIIGTHPPLA